MSTDEATLDLLEAREAPSPEDVVLDLDDLTRTAEALTMLKPQEVTALWMRASGRAYKEIASDMQWTYTKVNRCIAEGRKAFLAHLEAIDTGAACERWAPSLSAVFDGEAGTKERVQLRRHLRNCPGCRATALALHRTKAPLAAVLPGLWLNEPAVVQESSSFVVRVYEAAAHFATERAAASTLKVQAIIDTASMTKVTAVAASAAALAGGGAATVKDVVAPPKAVADPKRQEAKASPKRQRTAARSAAAVPAGIVRVPRPSGTRAASQRPATAIVQAGERERRLKAAARRRSAAAGAARPTTATAQATAEFSGLPGSSGGPSVQRASAAPATPAPAAASPSSSSSFERSAPAAAPTSRSTGSAAAEREFAP